MNRGTPAQRKKFVEPWALVASAALCVAIAWAPSYCEAENQIPPQSTMTMAEARGALLSQSSDQRKRLAAAKIVWAEMSRASKLLRDAAALDPSIKPELEQWHQTLTDRFKR